jgi:hypothetical protein
MEHGNPRVAGMGVVHRPHSPPPHLLLLLLLKVGGHCLTDVSWRGMPCHTTFGAAYLEEEEEEEEERNAFVERFCSFFRLCERNLLLCFSLFPKCLFSFFPLLDTIP